jgi:hypothetical protein
LLLAVMSGEGAFAAPSVKRVEGGLSGSVTSIAARAVGQGFAVAYTNCHVAFFDAAAKLRSQTFVGPCKRLFTIHLAQQGQTEIASVSAYTGQGVVISDGRVKGFTSHDAAVTEAFVAFGGLLTASDDGSVVFTPMDQSERRAPPLATGQGVARTVVLDPSGTAQQPAFFVGFDSGLIIHVSAGARTEFHPGVGRINGLALGHGGHDLYAAGFLGRLVRVDLATGANHVVIAGGADLNALSLDKTSDRLATVSDDGHFILVDSKSDRIIADLKLSDSPLAAVALAQGGHAALAGDSAGGLYLVSLPDRD